MDTHNLKVDVTSNWHYVFPVYPLTILNEDTVPGTADAAAKRLHPVWGRN